MKKSYVYAAISILLWSTFATSSKLLLGAFGNYQVLCISSLFAALFLICAVFVTGRGKLLKKYSIKDYALMALIGLPGTFFYYVFYYSGAERLPASLAFTVNYMWPIMSIVFACIILKERLTLRKCIAIAVSFVGVAIISGGNLFNFDAGILWGIIFCLLGAVSYGLFTALNTKYEYDVFVAMTVNSFAAFILSFAVIAAKQELFVPNLTETLGFLWNGIFVIAIPNSTWILALNCKNTSKISNLAYITPFLSLIWTFFVLGEPINILSVAGLAVIIIGILIQLKDKKEELK